MFGAGFVDAYNTVEVLKITVPDGIGWEYQGLSGNPLNFQNVTSASPVPEPAAAHLFAAGGLLVATLALRKRNRAR